MVTGPIQQGNISKLFYDGSGYHSQLSNGRRIFEREIVIYVINVPDYGVFS